MGCLTDKGDGSGLLESKQEESTLQRLSGQLISRVVGGVGALKGKRKAGLDIDIYRYLY